eukprot:CAMPEP_0181352960 /NCGR_PEP_ID=MMETSP1106-20121128/2584_1 /TAXON_ID=81844 /ORGANISM="Mantoniella antarctica, Strain SL-175" /LENGTH=327 /DNA_ID=CAMNT_0023465547 /DNA_START=282 /DNA_END=1262 /DNA_ORIENTATION=+
MDPYTPYSPYTPNAGCDEMATGLNRGQETLSTSEKVEIIEACCKIGRFGGGSGSGSLCDIDGVLCVMTNNHVISSKEVAEGATASFFSTCKKVYKFEVAFNPEKMFFTDKELDYTFVAVSEVPTLNSCAITAVRLVDEPLRCKDYIYIVQYPNGGDRKESSADVIEITDCGRFVHYACDTEYGSSGSSPVFKGNRVLALHHQRVPTKKCNRGVVMIAILADLQGKRAAYKADMDVLAEAKRKAVRKAKCKAAAEVEARRLAEKETAAKFAADVAEYKRKAGRKRVAEAQRKVAAEVEARRIAEEEAAAKREAERQRETKFKRKVSAW